MLVVEVDNTIQLHHKSLHTVSFILSNVYYILKQCLQNERTVLFVSEIIFGFSKMSCFLKLRVYFSLEITDITKRRLENSILTINILLQRDYFSKTQTRSQLKSRFKKIRLYNIIIHFIQVFFFHKPKIKNSIFKPIIS